MNRIAKGMDTKIHVSRNRDSLGVFTEEQLKMALGRVPRRPAVRSGGGLFIAD
jgi:hypothetical protein